MGLHRFDGRVAIITGAGRGIGRAYALLLAARGAAVVVNDLGGTMEGEGSDVEPAAVVVDEIGASGGTAIADHHDVASETGAESLVDAALARFGRVDIVINNAGIMRWAGLPEIDLANVVRHLDVHTLGSFNTTRAAWRHLVAQGYGRIVMTTSTGMFGLPNNLAYATAKAGVIGLARSLATAGREHGIKVNCIAPAAFTRMAGQQTEQLDLGTHGRARDFAPMSPDLVAPMAAFLAHEDCPVTGEVYTAGAGRFARLFIASTAGYVHGGVGSSSAGSAPSSESSSSAGPTVEDVAAHWATINDETGYTVPPDLLAWSKAFMAHLSPPGPSPPS